MEEVLRKRREALGGETDVTHVREVEQFRHELLEPDNGDVRDVAARHEHVPDLRRGAHVVEHRPPPLSFANGKPVLHDLLRALSYEIHPRAVPAVLWARSDELDEHLCRIAVREALHGPHVPLVQAVATGPRMARPLLVALRVGREHVAPDGVAPEVLLVHRVQHLRRNEQRHRRVGLLIALDVVCERVREVRTEDLRELPHVLHGVRQLPGARLPLRLRHVPESREPPPVGLDEVGARPG